MAAPTTPTRSDDTAGPGTTASAILVVLVIGLIAALSIIIFAFSTERTPHSVDGRSATTSQFID
jgi:hypothetical protein